MGGANVSRNTSRVGLITYLESHIIFWGKPSVFTKKTFYAVT